MKDVPPIHSLELPRDGLFWKDVFPGVVLVGGVNGSGKTTLLESIFNLVGSLQDNSDAKLANRLSPGSLIELEYEIAAAGEAPQNVAVSQAGHSSQAPSTSTAARAEFRPPGMSVELSPQDLAVLENAARVDGPHRALMQLVLSSVRKTSGGAAMLQLDPRTYGQVASLPDAVIRSLLGDFGRRAMQPGAARDGRLRTSPEYEALRSSFFSMHGQRRAQPRLVFFPTTRSYERSQTTQAGRPPSRSTLPFAWRRGTARTVDDILYEARWDDLNELDEQGRKGDRFDSIARGLDSFFKGEKKVRWLDGQLQVETRGGRRHAMEELSSGEKQVLLFVCELLDAWKPGSLILIDEPELHLHDTWLSRLWHLLVETQKQRGGQVIVASQSNLLFRLAAPGTAVLLGTQSP